MVQIYKYLSAFQGGFHMSGFSLAKLWGSFKKPTSTPDTGNLSTNTQTKDGLQTSGFTKETNNDSSDLSLIAVITAAVAMAMSGDNGSSATYPGFTVKRIRRLM